jgi:hypothetical protein
MDVNDRLKAIEESLLAMHAGLTAAAAATIAISPTSRRPS